MRLCASWSNLRLNASGRHGAARKMLDEDGETGPFPLSSRLSLRPLQHYAPASRSCADTAQLRRLLSKSIAQPELTTLSAQAMSDAHTNSQVNGDG